MSMRSLIGHVPRIFRRSYSIKITTRLLSGYIPVAKDDLDSTIPEGLAGDMDAEFAFSGKHSWMHREETKIVHSLIDNYQQLLTASNSSEANPFVESLKVNHSTDKIYSSGKDIPNKVLLTGDRGVGKSVILNQSVLYARQQGWLVLFVPNGWDHAQNGFYIEPISSRSGVTNIPNKNLFDNVEMTLDVLRGFYQAHSDKLANIKLRDSEAMAKKYDAFLKKFSVRFNRALEMKGRSELNFFELRRVILDEDHIDDEYEGDKTILEDFSFADSTIENLSDLVLLGIVHHDLAGIVFLDLVEELKELTTTPVLFAVDQYNTWDNESAFSYRNVAIPPRQMCVPYSLSFLSKARGEMEHWQVKNGLCIAAVSLKHLSYKQKNVQLYKDAISSIPITIYVEPYNNTEFESACRHYDTEKHSHVKPNEQHLKSFQMLVESNPGEMLKQFTPYFYGISDGSEIKNRDHPLLSVQDMADSEASGVTGEHKEQQIARS